MPTHLSPDAVQILDRFADAWNGAAQPRIEDFLSTCEPLQRLAVLLELVRFDMERRLRIGEPVRVEEAYFSRFPELKADPQILIALVAREFELRRCREPHLTIEEYVQRFPSLASFAPFFVLAPKLRHSAPKLPGMAGIAMAEMRVGKRALARLDTVEGFADKPRPCARLRLNPV